MRLNKSSNREVLTPQIALEYYKNQAEHFELSRYAGKFRYVFIEASQAERKQHLPIVLEILKQYDVLKFIGTCCVDPKCCTIDDATEAVGSAIAFYASEDPDDKLTSALKRLSKHQTSYLSTFLTSLSLVYDGEALVKHSQLKLVAYGLGSNTDVIPTSVEACKHVTLEWMLDICVHSTGGRCGSCLSSEIAPVNYITKPRTVHILNTCQESAETLLPALVDMPYEHRELCNFEHEFLIGQPTTDTVLEYQSDFCSCVAASRVFHDSVELQAAKEFLVSLLCPMIIDPEAGTSVKQARQIVADKYQKFVDERMMWSFDGLHNNVRAAIVQITSDLCYDNKYLFVLFIRSRQNTWAIHTLNCSNIVANQPELFLQQTRDFSDQANDTLCRYLALAAACSSAGVKAAISMTNTDFEFCRRVMQTSGWTSARYLGSLAYRSWAD